MLIAGKNRLIVMEGMGVVFDLSIFVSVKAEYLERVYGCVIGFKDALPDAVDTQYPVSIVTRIRFAKANLPSWLLSNLRGSDLLQSNLQLTISKVYLQGVYSIWPSCLYQGTCAPGLSDGHANDRIVVGHLQIRRKNPYLSG